MYVQRRRKRIEIWTPAKLNLFLEVLSRRDDGFHEIETLMLPVGLFDTLHFSLRSDDLLKLRVNWAAGYELQAKVLQDGDTRPAFGDVPEGPQNLVHQAILLLRSKVHDEGGQTLSGLDVQLEKRIPSASGLGGGSSDAAAALVGANEIWGLGWSRRRLAQVAAELGSDVSFFLDGSAAICRGRGERTEPFSVGRKLFFVIVRPPHGLSTPSVYRETVVPTSPNRLADFMAAFRALSIERWSLLLFNRLQQAATSIAPWLEALQQQFDRLGVLGHQLSGSGSCYFGICRHARHARQAACLLSSWGIGHVFCVATVVGAPGATLRTCQN